MGSSAARYVDKTRPLVISVTSTGDWATGNFFPLGTELSNAFRHFRDYHLFNHKGLEPALSQRYFVTHTPGHNDYLISHTVVTSPDIAGSIPLPTPSSSNSLLAPTLFRQAFEENLEHPMPPQGTGWNRTWRFRSVGRTGISWSTIIPNPKPEAVNKTPYWIIQVPPSIIKDHSDIFNEQSLCLYAALFRIDSPINKAHVRPGPRLMQLLPPAVRQERGVGY